MKKYAAPLIAIAFTFLVGSMCGIARADATSSSKAREMAGLQNAYSVMKYADKDYDGHRVRAMKYVEKACHELGGVAEGKHHGKKTQVISDDAMRQAEGLLKEVKDSAESASQDRLLVHVNHALDQIHIALKMK